MSPGGASIGGRPRRTGFVADVLRLAGGATLAQLIVFASVPVLSRLYDPSAFGAWALFAAVTAILGAIATLRYEAAIVLAETDGAAAALFWASSLIAALMGVVVLVLFSVMPSGLLTTLGGDHITGYAWLVALATVTFGVLAALTNWFTRMREFGALARARVANTSVSAVAQIGAGAGGLQSATALVLGSLAGTVVNTMSLASRSVVQSGQVLVRGLRLSLIVQQARRYWKFPAFNTGATLLNTVSWQIPVLLLGIYFGPIPAGYYSLGFRVLALPMSLVGSAIGQVLYQRAVLAQKAGNLDILLRNVFAALVDLGLVPFVILAMAGEDIFVVVFGAPWAEAGVYVQILAIFMLVWFISSPLHEIYLVLDRQRSYLWMNVIILATRVGSLTVGGELGDVRLGLAIFSLSGIAVYGYMSHYLLTRSGVPLGEGAGIVARAMARGILPCAPVAVALSFGAGSVIVFVLSLLAVAANTAYAVVTWRRLLGRREFDAQETPAT